MSKSVFILVTANSYGELIVVWLRLPTPPIPIMISSSQSPLLSVTPVWCMDTANFTSVDVRVCYSFLKHNIFSMKAKESFVVVWIVEEIRLEKQQLVSSTWPSKTLSFSLRTQRQCKSHRGSSRSLVLILFTRFSWDSTQISLHGSSEVTDPDLTLGRFAHGPARTFLDTVPSEGLSNQFWHHKRIFHRRWLLLTWIEYKRYGVVLCVNSIVVFVKVLYVSMHARAPLWRRRRTSQWFCARHGRSDRRRKSESSSQKPTLPQLQRSVWKSPISTRYTCLSPSWSFDT